MSVTGEQSQQDQQEFSAAGAGAELGSAGPATARVKLPFVSLDLSLPQVRVHAGGSQPAGGAGSAVGAVGVERIVLYGGAAALGVLGVLEWPVVLAAAGGTYVLSRLVNRGLPAAQTGPLGQGRTHVEHAEHDHAHGENCGHVAVPHGDHEDYLYDGHRHAAHGEHWDEH